MIMRKRENLCLKNNNITFNRKEKPGSSLKWKLQVGCSRIKFPYKCSCMHLLVGYLKEALEFLEASCNVPSEESLDLVED